MKSFLSFFSYLFHPLFTPSYASVFYFLVTKNFYYRHEIYLIFVQVLIVTILLPVSLFFLLRSLGLLRSAAVLDKKERRLPLAFYSLLLFVLIKHSFGVIPATELYYFFIGSLMTALLALALVLFHVKGSLHVAGVSALTMFVISISAYYHTGFLPLIVLLVLSTGVVASARVYNKTHTLGEVALGAALGILPQVALWPMWLFPSL